MTRDEITKAVSNFLEEKIKLVGPIREYEKYYGVFAAPSGSSGKIFVGNIILIDKSSKKVMDLDELDDDEYDHVRKERWKPFLEE